MDASMMTALQVMAAAVTVIFGMAVSILLWSFIVSLPLRVARWADPARFDSDTRAGRI